MARVADDNSSESDGFPHPRGDGPMVGDTSAAYQTISPPAWGWPGFAAALQAVNMDFPTRVGMARRNGTYARGV